MEAVARVSGRSLDGAVRAGAQRAREGMRLPAIPGEAFLLLSGAFFGVVPFFAKVIYAHGGTASGLLFLRFGIGALVFAALCRLRGISLKLDFAELRAVALLSVLETVTCMLLFTSYNYISSGLSTSLHFCYPAATIVLETLLFRSKVGGKKLCSCLFCVAGILLFYQPGGAVNLTGMALALLSGVMYATYIIDLTHSRAGKMPALKLSAWLSALVALEVMGISMLRGSFSLQMDATGWGMSVVMAAFISTAALLTFQIGAPRCGAQTAALLSTVEPLTSVLLGCLLLHESMTLRVLLGIGAILASILIQMGKKTESQKTQSREAQGRKRGSSLGNRELRPVYAGRRARAAA